MAIALLRVESVARILDVHPATVRRWIVEDRIPAVNLGDEARPSYRIERASLAAWLAARGLSLQSTSAPLQLA